MTWKQTIKRVLYSLQLYRIFHYLRNKDNLTVIMLHRVLPEGEKGWEVASPEWTVGSRFFEQLLSFVVKHYNVVSLGQVKNHCEGKAILPSRPLLITFDDGWTDSIQHANPILEKYKLPSLIFIATNAIDSPILSWQEALDFLARSKKLGSRELNEIERLLGIEGLVTTWRASGRVEDIIRTIDNTLDLDRGRVLSVITSIYSSKLPEHLMMSSDQVRQLLTTGMEIGGHGHLHEPLTKLSSPKEQLETSYKKLSELGGGKVFDSMSFPHSQYNESIVSYASSSGFRFLFGGGMRLHPVKKLAEAPEVIHRINIDQRALVDEKHRLQGDKLAHLLFFARGD